MVTSTHERIRISRIAITLYPYNFADDLWGRDRLEPEIPL